MFIKRYIKDHIKLDYFEEFVLKEHVISKHFNNNSAAIQITTILFFLNLLNEYSYHIYKMDNLSNVTSFIIFIIFNEHYIFFFIKNFIISENFIQFILTEYSLTR